MKQRIAGSRQTFWTALHRNSAVLAEFGFAEFGELGEVDVHVIRDEKVQRAILVIIGNGRAGGPAGIVYPGAIGNIREGAIAVVVVEMIVSEAGDV